MFGLPIEEVALLSLFVFLLLFANVPRKYSRRIRRFLNRNIEKLDKL